MTSLIIEDQFGIIQNFQTSLIPQTRFLVWTFFYRFLQQDSSISCAAMMGPGLAGETTTQGRAYGSIWGGASYRLSGAIFYYVLHPNVDILGSVCL